MAEGGRLSGKIAVVTGAAQGAIIIVADVQEQLGRQVAERIGGGASFLRMDVCQPDEWESAVARLVAEYGRIDVLVNNAGGGVGGHIGSVPLDVHQRVMKLNLDSVWMGSKAVIPAMEERGGSIVNISSIDGLVGIPHLSSYVASKFAVTGLTRSLAMELGSRNIRVNSVHPGITDTPMVRSAGPAMTDRMARSIARQPLPRIGQPADIGFAALFFASDESSYCTGSSLVVDGGHIAGPYRELVGDHDDL